jgi:hypothetical protein
LLPVEPGQTLEGAAIAVDKTALVIATVPVVLHPAAFFTVILSVTGLTVPALQMIAAVPAPEVIVPLMTVQT